MNMIADKVNSFLSMLLTPTSIWSIIMRGVIWLAASIALLVYLGRSDSNQDFKNLKSNLGFFLMFFTLAGGLIYLLFSFTA